MSAAARPITTYTGHGAAGDLTDPANWSGSAGIGPASIALIPIDAVLNGTTTVDRMMMLGDEAVTISGVLNTLSNQPCQSYMICNDAVVDFAPTALLNDAGGLIVGVEDTGTMVARGGAGGRAVLNSVVGKMGQHAGSIGHITIDGAVWNNATRMSVGEDGHGTLDVLDGGQVSNGGDLFVGRMDDGTGVVTLATGGTLAVRGDVRIGSAAPLSGPNGVVDIHAGSSLTSKGVVTVDAGGTVALSGGSLAVTLSGVAIDGGQITGYGSISAANGIDMTAGGIVAQGGTLALSGKGLFGGTVSIGADSTVQLGMSVWARASIAFAGVGAALVLQPNLFEHATITGFGAGDSILLAGVDHLGWNAATDRLTLSTGGHVTETLHFAGSYVAGSFDLTAGGLVTFVTH